MNRRNFISMMLGAAAGTGAAQYGLLEMECVNRVYSFPSQIRIASDDEIATIMWMRAQMFWNVNPRLSCRLSNITDPLPFNGGKTMQQPFIYSS